MLQPFGRGEAHRPVAWVDGRTVTMGGLLADSATLARRLPAQGAMVNLCEHRYPFLVGFGAALLKGHITLLPPSRASQVIAEISAAHPGSYCCDDAGVADALSVLQIAGRAADHARVEPAAGATPITMVAFTSGSTGHPARHPKQWPAVLASATLNARRLREVIASRERDQMPWIVATVPPQHMYGMEMSVLLPLLGDMAVHCGRPLFPDDVAAALAEIPAPRILVTTPVHLRALIRAERPFPEIALVVCATAPLDRELAGAAEQKFACVVLDFFGSTETCVIATRRPVQDDAWNLYKGIALIPTADGTRVEAPWFAEPTLLQDIVGLLPGDRFLLRGRNADMIEIAGKRASLQDLTRRLLAVPGVQDAVVFLPETADHGPVKRVSALVVAPGVSAASVLDALRAGVDEAFLPRPLVIVPALPRSEAGKLPRHQLLAALAAGTR